MQGTHGACTIEWCFDNAAVPFETLPALWQVSTSKATFNSAVCGLQNKPLLVYEHGNFEACFVFPFRPGLYIQACLYSGSQLKGLHQNTCIDRHGCQDGKLPSIFNPGRVDSRNCKSSPDQRSGNFGYLYDVWFHCRSTRGCIMESETWLSRW